MRLYTDEVDFTLSSVTITSSATGGSPTREPGTWALMILGFGAAGAALRRRRSALA